MVHAFIYFFVSLWGLVDVRDKIKSVNISVMERDPFTLHTEVNEIQKYLLIQWMFGHWIAEINRLTQTNSIYDAGGRFKDRLKLDQTGSLTITNSSTTDSGFYKLTVISDETSVMIFNVMVNETPQSTSSPPERLSSSIFLTSCCAVKNLTINQNEDVNITELSQPSSDHIHCCGFTETVIRLVVSALVSMAAVAFLVYDIRSTRNELNRTEEIKNDHLTHGVNSDQHQLSRRNSSRYVC